MSGFADGEVDCLRCYRSVDHHEAAREQGGRITWICPPPTGGPAKGSVFGVEPETQLALAILRQRSAPSRPWNPADGDRKCQRCYAPNVVWFADNDLWNDVMGGDPATEAGGVLCLRCFAEACQATGRHGSLHVSERQ